MEDLAGMKLAECTNSRFIRPLRLNYKHAGRDKVWDVVLCHSSVYVIIYNKTQKKLVFVKQFRPAVYFSHIRRDKEPEEFTPGTTLDVSSTPGSVGITLELCAGIVDKSKPLIEVAQDEIEEECGYKVPIDQILVSSCVLGSIIISDYEIDPRSNTQKGDSKKVVFNDIL